MKMNKKKNEITTTMKKKKVEHGMTQTGIKRFLLDTNKDVGCITDKKPQFGASGSLTRLRQPSK